MRGHLSVAGICLALHELKDFFAQVDHWNTYLDLLDADPSAVAARLEEEGEG